MKTAAWPSIVRQCQTQNPFMFYNIIGTQVNILDRWSYRPSKLQGSVERLE